MADIVYLSLWLRDFNKANMLDYWEKVIGTFPASEKFPGVRTLTIHPLNWQEAALFERSFAEGATGTEAVELATELLHDDCAYEAEMKWDLWFPEVSENRKQVTADEDSGDDGEYDNVVSIDRRTQPDGWSRKPVTVSIACLGPAFASEDAGDRPHILISLGLDTPFLPPDDVLLEGLDDDGDNAEEIDWELADVRGRENLQQLIGLVHRLDESLPVANRVLWSESGENLAEKILDAWDVFL